MRPRSLVLCIVALAGAGCIDAREATPAPESFELLELAFLVSDTGFAREPAVAAAPDGSIFVAGFSYQSRDPRLAGVPNVASAPPLWRSDDGGDTWTAVDVGSPVDGAIGNSDVALAVAPDGTVYLAGMAYTFGGNAIAIGAGTDNASAWRWSLLSTEPVGDRPFVLVSPKDATAHVVWNDGIRVRHAASRDRGASWSESAPAHAPGGNGMLAIAPDGDLAVRVIPSSGSSYTQYDGADGVAVSQDDGATWEFRPLPGNRTYGTGSFGVFDRVSGDGTIRWADPLAFDAAGELYAAWGEEGALHLARSSDMGTTWDVAIVAEGAGRVIFPHLASDAQRGGLALLWATQGEANATVHVATLARSAESLAIDRVATYVAHYPGGDPGGEVLAAVWRADGSLLHVNARMDDDGAGYVVYAAGP